MTIPTHKDTYDHLELLLNEELNMTLGGAHLSASGEALVTLKEDLRVLYKHLENVQAMRTSYSTCR